MRNVYLAQPTNMLSKAVYLPYAVGTLAAYAWQFEEIRQNYRLKEFLFLKTPIDEVLEKMENPYLVGFSNYLWNVRYNLELARKVKEKWSECIIVFGGPQVPDDTEYLKDNSFIDVLIHSEGEVPFYKLLAAYLEDGDLTDVPGVSYRKDGELLKNEKKLPLDLTNFPSPYTEGYFDDIINNPEYEGLQFDVVLETNRGCPYNCAYCYWGGNNDPLRCFPMERVKGDLDWFAANKIAFCICADGNFGIFSRDEEIVDYISDLKKKYGYPVKFESIAAKEKDDFIFKINKKFHEAGLNNGVSVACQSMSPVVLKNVGRKNTSKEQFAQSLDRYLKAGINTYTDIMLGLPGETFESFCKGIFDVIEAGQHYSININRCELLPNSIMYSKDFVERFKIKTRVSSLCQNHSKASDEGVHGSRSELIIETDSMSRKEWAESCKVASYAQSFHFMGLMRFVSVYLRKAKGLSYYDFYMNLYNRINSNNGITKEIFDRVMKNFDDFVEGKTNLFFADERFGDVYWPHEQALYLCILYQFDEIFSEMKEYIRGYFDDEELFEDLFSYQKNIICSFGEEIKDVEFEYDWISYFKDFGTSENNIPERKKIKLRFEPSYQTKWFEYAREIVWYGKRSGRTIVKPVVIE